jgi:hypothetical protein
MKFSKKYIENQKLRSKPVSHFESLAKDGFLNQYIEEFLPEKYRTDLSFREEIMKLQVKYSDVPVAEISKEYLKELSKSLSYFDNLVNTQ